LRELNEVGGHPVVITRPRARGTRVTER
jgi:hypothetical protein